MPDLTPEKLAELRWLAEAATPGPWEAFGAVDGRRGESGRGADGQQPLAPHFGFEATLDLDAGAEDVRDGAPILLGREPAHPDHLAGQIQ